MAKSGEEQARDLHSQHAHDAVNEVKRSWMQERERKRDQGREMVAWTYMSNDATGTVTATHRWVSDVVLR